MTPRERLIVAIDEPDVNAARALIDRAANFITLEGAFFGLLSAIPYRTNI